MPTANYDLILTAMRERKQVICTYESKRREVCPVILGHTEGQEKALTFQFGGESNSRLPPGGQWRCLALAGVTNIVLRDGLWHAGREHRTRHECVKVVDYDVNPNSLYTPNRL